MVKAFTFLAPLALVIAGGCESSAPTEATVASEAAFPALTGRVVDQADLLSPQQERLLSDKSKALETRTGPQFVIVTVPSLAGMTIENYGLTLARQWGVGDRQRNDGLLLIVAPVERKMRIEVGYGLEKNVPDAFAAKVIREVSLPRFAKGEYGIGILETSDALIKRMISKRTDDDFIEEKLAA